MSCQVREKVIILFDDYTTIVYKDKYEAKKRKGLKMLPPTQMLQRQPITLAQVKAGNTSENLFNKIRQIMYSLYWEKEVTWKVYSNIMNSIKL